MACKIIDVHHYERGSYPDPSNPLEPMCVPAEAYDKMMDNKIVPAIVMLTIADLTFITLGLVYQKNLWVLLPMIIAAVFINICAVRWARKVKDKFYKNLTDPSFNPTGYTYQGRVLDHQDPHFLLHLNYYTLNKTWTLPDESEWLPPQGNVEAKDFFGK